MMLSKEDLEALQRWLERAAADESCAVHGADALRICSDCGVNVRCERCGLTCRCRNDE
jgi:hypothetical protein